jgi:methionine-rich copper-binding protein CopC
MRKNTFKGPRAVLLTAVVVALTMAAHWLVEQAKPGAGAQLAPAPIGAPE